MDDLPRQKLAEILTKYGQCICDEPKRCEGLLKDLCGQHRKEVAALVGALKEDIPTALLKSSKIVPPRVLVAQLSQRLENNLGLAENVAQWAVESWALALQLVSLQEIYPSPSPQTNTTPPQPSAVQTVRVTPTPHPTPTPTPSQSTNHQTNPIPTNTPTKNNLIPTIVTAVLVGLGVCTGFLLNQQIRDAQLVETQAKLEVEENATSLPPREKIVENNSYKPSLSLQDSCGDKPNIYSEWWAVRGETSALNIVKNNYCADAFIIKGQTQAASFSSENAARNFANTLTQESGYTFRVEQSLPPVTAYIQYKHDYIAAQKLKDYLTSLGINVPTEIFKQDNIILNDIRYYKTDSKLVDKLKGDIEKFYKNQKSFELKNLSVRGYEDKFRKFEIWINE